MAKTEYYDLVLKGAEIVNHDGRWSGDIAVHKGQIAALGSIDESKAQDVINCAGLHILPGVIDSQVHFREPGMTHKEDLASGSRGAVMGGVTAVFEMPNTAPLTVSAQTLADKVARGRKGMFCDFAFYIGGTHDNIQDLPQLERLPGSAGVKVFIGSSTGDLLVDDDEGLHEILKVISRRAAFHSEDEARLIARREVQRENDPSSHPEWRDEIAAMNSTKRLVSLARKTGKRIHVLHISTAEEIEYLVNYKDVASVEVTPQHLTLAAPEAYDRLGTLAQMNPPIRGARHREALWRGLQQGVVDVLGSDHAPHTLEEKSKPYPRSPSGMTGVQTLVPIMLDHVNKGRLSLERFVDLTSHGPQRIFGLADKGRIAVGYDADFTIIDLAREQTIEASWIESISGWTPYDGMSVKGWPVGTIVRGKKVMWQGEIIGEPSGQPVRFHDNLAAQ